MNDSIKYLDTFYQDWFLDYFICNSRKSCSKTRGWFETSTKKNFTFYVSNA